VSAKKGHLSVKARTYIGYDLSHLIHLSVGVYLCGTPIRQGNLRSAQTLSRGARARGMARRSAAQIQPRPSPAQAGSRNANDARGTGDDTDSVKEVRSASPVQSARSRGAHTSWVSIRYTPVRRTWSRGMTNASELLVNGGGCQCRVNDDRHFDQRGSIPWAFRDAGTIGHFRLSRRCQDDDKAAIENIAKACGGSASSRLSFSPGDKHGRRRPNSPPGFPVDALRRAPF
jgi:hypothetical protein